MADDGSDFARSMSIATSGLRAQAGRMRVISENIANADSTASTAGGDPYRRKVPTFSSTLDRSLDAQVVSLGWQASDKLNLSAELWGGWDWDPAGTTRQASADGSVAYLLSNDVQLDAGANFGLNRATPDVEIYGGVSKRF